MSILKRQSLRYTLYLVVGIKFILFSGVASAACDCRSTDQNKPCTGNSISVTVRGEQAEGYRTINFNWSFNSEGAPASCGQFANGDYWVAPANGKNSVTVSSVTGSGSGTLYIDENPTLEATGILSNGTNDYGNFDKSENLAGKSVTRSNSTSLVAAIQRNESRFGGCGTKLITGSCVDAYNVLTILDKVPVKAGSVVLRPNITRAQKELLTWDDFDLNRLPAVNYLSGTDEDGLEEIRKIWTHQTEVLSLLDKQGDIHSEGGRAFRADLVTDDYAATVAQQWHNHVMFMLSDDHSFIEKAPSLAAMLTYGKDIFYSVYTPTGNRERFFGSGAGQYMGRFPAAAFFASLAKDGLYSNTLSLASSTMVDSSNPGVQEMEQINRGANGPVWGDGHDIYNQYDLGRYWEELLRSQSFDGASGKYAGKIVGRKTSKDPYGYIDGPGYYPGSLYASVTAGPTKALAAQMLLIPEMCSVVNYDPIIDYSIRITSVGLLTKGDECAPPDPREDPGSCNPYHAKGCTYYGLNYTSAPTWGPDPKDLKKCIKNSGNQKGRYASKHGEAFDIGYPSAQVEKNWSKILAGRTSCRNVDKPQPPQNVRKAD